MPRYYGTVHDSLKGKFAIQIPVAYEFFGSGLILQPVIKANLWGMSGVEFVFNNGQLELGKAFGYDQQSISRYLKKGAELQAKISAGTYHEADIWGYSPTDQRRQEVGIDLPSLDSEATSRQAEAPSGAGKKGRL